MQVAQVGYVELPDQASPLGAGERERRCALSGKAQSVVGEDAVGADVMGACKGTQACPTHVPS